jgi:inner membrane protein
MPSPLGHSLMGYILYRASARPVAAHQWPHTALYLFAANAPDLDFVPGLFVGDIARYHHGPSHSIAFAIFFGVCAGAVFSRRFYAFVMGFSLYLSHILLDYLVQDPSPPLGVPLFWPFTHEYYIAPFAFYRAVNYPVNFDEPMMRIVFSFHNFLTLLAEVVLLLPVLAIVSYCRRSSLGCDTVWSSWCGDKIPTLKKKQ